ncbi:MAG: MoxR family ATPase [Elusimicrobia bacterium]|nr:MoxR family ATPase [Elusimicrobiota bacterium]
MIENEGFSCYLFWGVYSATQAERVRVRPVEENPPKKDLELVERLSEARKAIVGELRKVIVGQEAVIEELLIALFCRGHCLLVGVPGLAKTLMVSSLARILDLEFRRIQFTPDLMPSDITGTEVIQEDPATRERHFRFIPGPVFAQILLADEINRTSPKTQSALLQGMQEWQVTVAGRTHSLPEPFFVLATQNPIEQEGTYPLPEAQLDRFLFQVHVDYPDEREEQRIVSETTGEKSLSLRKVLDARQILGLQEVVRRVPASEEAVGQAVRWVRLTRPTDGGVPDFIAKWVAWGGGPRASQALILGAKARAILHGRYAVSEEDLRALAAPVLRHRLIPSFQAEAEGIRTDKIVEKLLSY